MKSKLLPDLVKCAVLALVSLGLGLAVNLIRPEPLPIVYVRPAQQLLNEQEGSNGARMSDEWLPGVHVIDLVKMQDIVASKSAFIADARPDLFFEFGHIPGAKNLAEKNFDADYRRLMDEITAASQNGLPVLIYCANTHCPDAGKVSGKLQDLGISTILIFEGGYQEWESAGLKIEEAK